MDKCDALRAKIEQMERQAPAAEVESWTNGSYSRNYKLRWLKDVAEGDRLYALPGAQPAPSVPNRITPEQAPAEIREYDPMAAEGYADGWNACIKAMLAAAPKPEGE